MDSIDFNETTFTLKITNEDIDDIMKKALDECIFHWYRGVKQKYNTNIPNEKIISNGGSLLFYGIDERIYELHKEKFILGLQQALPYLTNSINVDTLNTNLIDSDTADFIIQLGLFNELIFD